MDKHFNKVKNFLFELNYVVKSEIQEDSLMVVENPEAGIDNLIIDCEDPILIIELLLFELKEDNYEVFKNLLQKNREVIHGAFALDGDGKKVVFRDTLQLENLDRNELQGSLNSLEMMLSEYGNELIGFAKV
ncbi:MAG: YbjN domain-containing protein [Marinifilaceae bacterium]